MKHKAYIFDFDGTLVQSNLLKRQAFYQISDEVLKHKAIVDKVLSLIPERSRFEIIREIYGLIHFETGDIYDNHKVDNAIKAYSSIVRDGVMSCPEVEGASELLANLKRLDAHIYISSNTPEESLGELISVRNWTRHIDSYFGFPRLKTETVRFILESKQLNPAEVIVIGDGVSDEISASENGCSFYKISHKRSLFEFNSLVTSSNFYV